MFNVYYIAASTTAEDEACARLTHRQVAPPQGLLGTGLWLYHACCTPKATERLADDEEYQQHANPQQLVQSQALPGPPAVSSHRGPWKTGLSSV